MESSPYLYESGLTPLGEVVDPNTESGATVFADHPNQELIVACRGSANPRNFGTNLKFNPVPATRLSQINVPSDALVHSGFQEASVGLWQKVGPPLLETLKRQPFESEIKDVVFTGHSLGAATAQLCAVHYMSTAKDLGNAFIKPRIVTFGGPKLCNGSLARYLRNGPLEGVDILHLVHSQDPILVNNERLWNQMGFENVGIEMECDPSSPTVYCDEDDEQCAVYGAPPPNPKRPRFGMKVAWNIMNHCNYMGVFVGPRIMAGRGGGGGNGQQQFQQQQMMQQQQPQPPSQRPGISLNNPGQSIRSDQDRLGR
eukprot:CAMPEP_0176026426 /NCGR_PEP_ID=MMETSP0120_2-20121206/12945_1 /TAXON_ID=160619 /ORGANISM="Kryptoperidinium foliaceum, Strain CCMP 1326" /LENGTH=312 /DNA_ID=CAMNT_0017359623 /DNA_START=152 /DNA_END=1090 /DNA_ORIENTATION=-